MSTEKPDPARAELVEKARALYDDPANDRVSEYDLAVRLAEEHAAALARENEELRERVASLDRALLAYGDRGIDGPCVSELTYDLDCVNEKLAEARAARDRSWGEALAEVGKYAATQAKMERVDGFERAGDYWEEVGRLVRALRPPAAPRPDAGERQDQPEELPLRTRVENAQQPQQCAPPAVPARPAASDLPGLEKWARDLARDNPREFIDRFRRTMQFYEKECGPSQPAPEPKATEESCMGSGMPHQWSSSLCIVCAAPAPAVPAEPTCKTCGDQGTVEIERRERVTRDMASDAGEPAMEGQEIDWGSEAVPCPDCPVVPADSASQDSGPNARANPDKAAAWAFDFAESMLRESAARRPASERGATTEET